MTNYNFSDLKDKTVIIIGGFGLIGKAICNGFINLESNIIIADKIKNIEFLKQLNNLKLGSTTYFPFDISKDKEIEKLIKKAVSPFDEPIKGRKIVVKPE